MLLSFPVSNTPRNLALSGSAIWVLSSSPNSAVRAYNTSSGKALSGSTALAGAPFGLVASGGAMWIFTQKYVYKFSTSTYKQLARYAQTLPPGSTIFNGRAVAAGLGGIWMLSQQCQLYRFITSSHSVDVKTITGASCGNGTSALALASGSMWTNLLGGSISNKGSGVADQQASLSGSVAVTVVEILANGNLVVRGEKKLGLSEGTEVIQVSGVIRPQDIGPNGTVQSLRLANAQISYRGSGDLAVASKPGWGTSALMKFWPF